MYEILIESRAERDLKKLPGSVFRQIIKNILSLKENPRPHGVRKILGSKNDWRIRIGDYRIIYEILDKEKIIKIYQVKLRKEAYR